ncbi:hypothetical protein KAX17_16320, partial [Candidatus Bipolaricaulota bacterium]|nr:hypothetical protein [Candidatus Bipolaricaulota bacterium]
NREFDQVAIRRIPEIGDLYASLNPASRPWAWWFYLPRKSNVKHLFHVDESNGLRHDRRIRAGKGAQDHLVGARPG